MLIPFTFPRTLLCIAATALISSAVTFNVTAAFMTGQAAQEALATERATLAMLTSANAKLRAAESKAALDLSLVSTHYQEQLRHAENRQKSITDELRTGALRMRVAVKAGSCVPAAAALATTASGFDGGETAELPAALAEALTDFAFDADATALQLGACQALVRQQWLSMNSYAGEP